MPPRKLLIIGNYGAGNLGDDAILGGILTDLKNVNWNGEVLVTCGGQKTSTEIYKRVKRVPFMPSGLKSHFARTQVKTAQQAFESIDMVIMGGGGLFTDSESLRAPYIWYKQAKALIRAKKPYVIYGQSIGPLRSIWSRHFARKTFKHAKAILVRDQESLHMLSKWGLKGTLGTDPALSWLTEELQKQPKKEAVLLISLRHWPKLGLKEWKTWTKPINEYCKKAKLKPIALSMEPTSEKEKRELTQLGWELYAPSSAREALFAFQKAKEALVMRLHAGIFSLTAKTPFIALAYSQKVTSFFESLMFKTPIQILTPPQWTPHNLRDALKQNNRAPTFNAEEAIQKNRHFLKEQLQDV